MTSWLDRIRHTIRPRSMEWGNGKAPKASDIILAMTLVLMVVAAVAKVLTELFTAT
jgi:hypothetical protein